MKQGTVIKPDDKATQETIKQKQIMKINVEQCL